MIFFLEGDGGNSTCSRAVRSEAGKHDVLFPGDRFTWFSRGINVVPRRDRTSAKSKINKYTTSSANGLLSSSLRRPYARRVFGARERFGR